MGRRARRKTMQKIKARIRRRIGIRIKIKGKTEERKRKTRQRRRRKIRPKSKESSQAPPVRRRVCRGYRPADRLALHPAARKEIVGKQIKTKTRNIKARSIEGEAPQ